MELRIQWFDTEDGEIYDENENFVALIGYEDGVYKGSVSIETDKGEDIWFTGECDSETEVLEEIESFLELTDDLSN